MLRLTLLVLAVLAFLSLEITAQTSYTLSHRFLPFPSVNPLPPFVPRGVVTLHPNHSVSLSFSEGSGQSTQQTDDGSGWYQLSLDGADAPLLASTRACLVTEDSISKVVLYLSDDSPTSLTIHQTGTPRSGECAVKSSVKLPSSSLEITIKTPSKAFSPALAAPPQIDQSTGKVAEPPVEKSFLAKYWMPILGIMLFFASQVGGDEGKRGAAAAAK
ncbi:ER membrane protein complex subunit 10, partial [Tremellales sp. Uapishka_1]